MDHRHQPIITHPNSWNDDFNHPKTVLLVLMIYTIYDVRNHKSISIHQFSNMRQPYLLAGMYKQMLEYTGTVHMHVHDVDDVLRVKVVR